MTINSRKFGNAAYFPQAFLDVNYSLMTRCLNQVVRNANALYDFRKRSYFGYMVNTGNHPWKTKTQEDIDTVTSGHITDGIICVLFSCGCGFRGKCIRQRSSQGNKSNGCKRYNISQ